MAVIQFDHVGITALSGAVPRTKINNYKYTQFFSEAETKDVVDKVGVYERRFADEKTCSSDLCYAAAEKLLTENGVNRNDIDLLIFVSQTPDYRMPATSILLQHRLGLPNTTICFDISLGCSGFIYGLSVIYAMMNSGNFKKALLLDGETRSKVYSPKDRRVAFIFGDAGVAALIEKDKKFGKSYFSMNSDGSREDLIKINGGGYRTPSSLETLTERIVDEYGNIRNDEQGYINGGDVFNFVIREIPKDIKTLLAYSGLNMLDLDYYVFHQANKFINSFLANKLKLDLTRTPSNIEKFGNTSSVSVPLTIISELKDKLHGDKSVLLSAFGVGMTWATGIINLNNCKISELVEI